MECLSLHGKLISYQVRVTIAGSCRLHTATRAETQPRWCLLDVKVSSDKPPVFNTFPYALSAWRLSAEGATVKWWVLYICEGSIFVFEAASLVSTNVVHKRLVLGIAEPLTFSVYQALHKCIAFFISYILASCHLISHRLIIWFLLFFHLAFSLSVFIPVPYVCLFWITPRP